MTEFHSSITTVTGATKVGINEALMKLIINDANQTAMGHQISSLLEAITTLTY